jgi:RNA polymerase sigma-70 factor (ECF subfamily)
VRVPSEDDVKGSDVEDLAGYERFCAEAHPRLVAALGHHLGDPWVGEELAQEALVRAGDRWAQVRALDSPLGWCYRVGVNLGRSQLRRRRAERRALRRHGGLRDHHVDDDTPDRLAVRAALRQLTEPQRRAVILRYYLGLNSVEAAAVLDIAPTAVRAQLHRGVAALRQHLELAPLPEEAIDGA